MITESTGKVYVGVVDDDESMLRSLVRLLRAAGYCAIGYGSAEDFLGDLKRPVFDCLILDVQLDDIAGTELAHKLVDSGAKAPIIFLSAIRPEEVAATIRPDSRFRVLHKGQPGSVLLDAIKTSIRRSAGDLKAEVS